MIKAMTEMLPQGGAIKRFHRTTVVLVHNLNQKPLCLIKEVNVCTNQLLHFFVC